MSDLDAPLSTAHDYVLDRFEDNGWAVLEREDGETFNIPKAWVPSNAREGDVLVVEKLPELSAYGLEDEPSSTLDIYVDEEETNRRRQKAKTARASLPRGPEGDLEL
jgi:hypothetical protein